MRRMVEALAEDYESTYEGMKGPGGRTPRCPLCGVTIPVHKAGCDFGRFLEERRTAPPAPRGRERPPPPDAEAIVSEVSQRMDGLFDAYNRTRRPAGGPGEAAAPWPPSAEWLWRLHAAHMQTRGWTIVAEGGLQVDGPAQQEAFKPIYDVLSRLAPCRAFDGPARAAAWPPSAEYLWRLHAAYMLRRGWAVMTLSGLQVDGPTQREAFGPICNALSRLDAARMADGPQTESYDVACLRLGSPRAVAAEKDEAIARLVVALGEGEGRVPPGLPEEQPHDERLPVHALHQARVHVPVRLPRRAAQRGHRRGDRWGAEGGGQVVGALERARRC
jgi:hypothetical protein